MSDKLKCGYTTGTCSAVGIKAGLEALINNNYLEQLEFTTLNGEKIVVPIYKIKARKNSVSVAVTKYAGDDPDVTNGINICTKIKLVDKLPHIENGIYFKNFVLVGGRGIGKVTKFGLQVEIGKPAINPGPQKMIEEVADKFLEENGKKAIITIYVPEGREKAKKTFNPKLGIVGGISILGSTGIVKPMSEEALKDSMFVELKVLRMAKDRDWCIFTFGNYSKNYCEKLGLDLEQTIVISNYVGFMVDSAVKLGFKKILLLGHIGKAIKIAGGIFNTHSRVADARVEIMGANAFLCGESPENIHKIMESNTVEEACDYIEKKEFFPFIANKVKKRVEEYSRGELECEVLLFSFKGDTLGYSERFYQMAGELAEKN